MITAQDVRALALTLPRTEERLVRDRVKFAAGRLVYVALARDETSMGFAFPKEERAALVAGNPDKFRMPVTSDLRYNWVRAWMPRLELDEMRELVVDAWALCVPKSVSRDYFRTHG
jgi:hypothetical protein